MNANNQVIMASGPFFRDVSGQHAAVAFRRTGEARRPMPISTGSALIFPQQHHEPAADRLAIICAAGCGRRTISSRTLGIYPTADGYRLVWKVAKFSTNPFGLYMVTVDAHTGEIVARKDFVNFQTAPGSRDRRHLSEISARSRRNLKDKSIISTDCGGTPVRPGTRHASHLRPVEPRDRA